MGQVKRHRPIQKGPAPRPPQSDGASGAPMTPGSIEEYLAFYQEQGCSEETLQSYRRKLEKLYGDLPEDKIIRHGFMNRWRRDIPPALSTVFSLPAILFWSTSVTGSSRRRRR